MAGLSSNDADAALASMQMAELERDPTRGGQANASYKTNLPLNTQPAAPRIEPAKGPLSDAEVKKIANEMASFDASWAKDGTQPQHVENGSAVRAQATQSTGHAQHAARDSHGR